jgi:hypothetical protein
MIDAFLSRLVHAPCPSLLPSLPEILSKFQHECELRGKDHDIQNSVELSFPQANLEALPAHVPSYLTASVGPPRTASRRHFCQVCGFLAPYTCTRCGARFCSAKCQTVHNDTRCLKFVV